MNPWRLRWPAERAAWGKRRPSHRWGSDWLSWVERFVCSIRTSAFASWIWCWAWKIALCTIWSTWSKGCASFGNPWSVTRNFPTWPFFRRPRPDIRKKWHRPRSNRSWTSWKRSLNLSWSILRPASRAGSGMRSLRRIGRYWWSIRKFPRFGTRTGWSVC